MPLRQKKPGNASLPTNFAVAAQHSFKFSSVGPADSRGDLCHMRTAEMYLIEAEALARQGGQDGQAAQVLYDLVITRDPEYQLSTNTGAALIEEIMPTAGLNSGVKDSAGSI